MSDSSRGALLAALFGLAMSAKHEAIEVLPSPRPPKEKLNQFPIVELERIRSLPKKERKREIAALKAKYPRG